MMWHQKEGNIWDLMQPRGGSFRASSAVRHGAAPEGSLEEVCKLERCGMLVTEVEDTGSQGG